MCTLSGSVLSQDRMDLSFVYGQIDVVIRCKIAKLFSRCLSSGLRLCSHPYGLFFPRMPPPLFVVLLFSLSPVDRKIKLLCIPFTVTKMQDIFFSIEDRKSGNFCLYMHRRGSAYAGPVQTQILDYRVKRSLLSQEHIRRRILPRNHLCYPE